jgi:hypothetical protein
LVIEPGGIREIHAFLGMNPELRFALFGLPESID